MSTYRTGYVILGVDLFALEDAGLDHKMGDFDDRLEKIRSDTAGSDLVVVFDGMNCDYCFLGKVLSVGEYDQKDCAGLEMKSWDWNELAPMVARVQSDLLNLLNLHVEHARIRLFVFTHWH